MKAKTENNGRHTPEYDDTLSASQISGCSLNLTSEDSQNNNNDKKRMR